MTQVIAQNKDRLIAWLAATNSEPNKNITKTVYDEAYSPICAGNYMCQQNLRNRVSHTYVQAVENASTIIPPWETATFYTYDIHGNVDVLLQDYNFGYMKYKNPNLLPPQLNDPSNIGGNRYKKTTYKYDLISGKVNEVAYQPGYADAFYHKYEYDAENKLTETYTSKEQVYWEREASYKYYRHGPLARTVLGELEVQGVDYAYTLQGWLKGVNSTGLQAGGAIGNGEDCGPNSAVENLYVYNRLSPYPQKYVARTSVNFMPSTFESNTPDNFEAYIDPLLSTCEADGTAGDDINSPDNNAAFDMGQDGKTNATGNPLNTTNPDVYGNNIRTTDAYGYSLNYFNGDYNRIDQSAANPFAALNMPLPTGGDAATPFTGNQLFNGNIGAMVVGIPKLGAAKVYAYNYDQLNRITNMFAFNGLNGATNTFTPIAINDYKEAVTYDANGNILTYKRNGVNAPVAGAPGGLNMDDLAYEYIPNSNKLKRVTDNPAYTGNYPDDIDTQTDADNYVYDEIGNLIQDKAEGINSIEWTVYGKISKIIKVKPAGTTTITYTYDASGNRISKNVVSPGLSKTTYYVRDASGNVMSVYENGDATVNTGQLTQTELHMYGSSRLGVYNVQVNVQTESRTFINMPGVTGNNAEMVTFTRGNKFFELSNHLGNVLVTISDKKIVYDVTNDGIAEYYTADVITANDYYPFGMQMPGRKYSTSSSKYRYGFNGKEKSDEITNDDYDYEARIYDGRLGKWFSVDPHQINYTSLSPYSFCANNPILYIDKGGNDIIIYYYDLAIGEYREHIRIITDKYNVERCTNVLLLPMYNGAPPAGGWMPRYDYTFDMRKYENSMSKVVESVGEQFELLQHLPLFPDAITIQAGFGLVVGSGIVAGSQVVIMLNGPNAFDVYKIDEYSVFDNMGFDIGGGVEFGLAWHNPKLNEEPTINNFAAGDAMFVTLGAGSVAGAYQYSNLAGDGIIDKPSPWRWQSVSLSGELGPTKIEIGGSMGLMKNSDPEFVFGNCPYQICKTLPEVKVKSSPRKGKVFTPDSTNNSGENNQNGNDYSY